MKVSNNQYVFQDFKGGVKAGFLPPFGAYNAGNSKNDTLEVSKPEKNPWISKENKKFLKSLGLAVLTTIGLAYLGNKLSYKTAKLGNKADEILKNNKWYQMISQWFSSKKEKTVKFLLDKSEAARDIAETFKNRHAEMKWVNITMGYGNGPQGIFKYTVNSIRDNVFRPLKEKYNLLSQLESVKEALKNLKPGAFFYNWRHGRLTKKLDAINQILKETGSKTTAEAQQKMADSIGKSISKLVGKDKAAAFADEILGRAAMKGEFADNLTKAMADYLGCTVDSGKFTEMMAQWQKTGMLKGVNAKEFLNVQITEKGITAPIASWWPVNFIEKAVRKLTGKKDFMFGRANLPDSLVKYNAVKGTLAATAIGGLIQKSVTVPTEVLSSHVNDKSGLGVYLQYGMLTKDFDNMQDAPKEKKAGTLANSFISSIASFALIVPMAKKVMYGLATLGNLKGSHWITKLLKIPGRFFNTGLDKYAMDGTIINTFKPGNLKSLSGIMQYFKNGLNHCVNIAGGGMRAYMMLSVISAMLYKPINSIVSKIFGKPYDPDEAARVKAEAEIKAAYEAEMRRRQNAASSGAKPGRIQGVNVLNQVLAQKAAERKENAIAASKLNTGTNRQRAYVPSTAVDNSYVYQEENERNQRAARILRSTDAEIARYSRALHG